MKLLKVLAYIAKKGRLPLTDWDDILYSEIKQAYNSGQISQKYQISFEDLLSKYNIEVSLEDIKILLKWKLGSVSDLEARIICAIAKGIKAERIFEIGTYLGRTDVNLAYNTGENTRIYTLDLSTDTKIGKYIKENKKVANKIIQLVGDSRSFDFSPYYNKIDLMFIDGGHDYETVLNDGKKAVKCVRNGGFIIWHDFTDQFLGLSKAVIKICEENKFDLHRIDVTRLAIAKVKK